MSNQTEQEPEIVYTPENSTQYVITFTASGTVGQGTATTPVEDNPR